MLQLDALLPSCDFHLIPVSLRPSNEKPTLFARKQERDKHMRNHGTLCTVTIGLSLLVLPGSGATTEDPGAVGPYAVGHISLMLRDASRDQQSPYGSRPIYVSVFYPADRTAITATSLEALYPLDPIAGRWPVSRSSHWERYGVDRAYESAPVAADRPFPLVMYSPGWGAPYFSGLFASTRLASHGFVVAVLAHYADGAYPWDPWPAIHVSLMNRPRDISFALSAILAMNDEPGTVLSDAIHADQVAAAGHSVGGYAALVLAGGDDLHCDRPVNEPRGLPIPPETCVASAPDPRIKATVSFDGSSQILWFHELARVSVPAIVIGQAWETVGAWHAREHAAISAQPNYRVDVAGALHPSFTTFCENARVLGDVGALTPAQVAGRLSQPWCAAALRAPEVERLATKYAIAFLKTHLTGEPGYQHILTPGWAITSEQNIEFFVTERTNAHATEENLPCQVPTCPAFGYFPNQAGSQREQAERDPAHLTPAIELPYRDDSR